MSVSVIMDRILPADWCGRQSPLVDWPLMGGDFGSEGKIEICRPDTGITPARPAVLLTENGLWSVDPDFFPALSKFGRFSSGVQHQKPYSQQEKRQQGASKRSIRKRQTDMPRGHRSGAVCGKRRRHVGKRNHALILLTDNTGALKYLLDRYPKIRRGVVQAVAIRAVLGEAVSVSLVGLRYPLGTRDRRHDVINR